MYINYLQFVNNNEEISSLHVVETNKICINHFFKDYGRSIRILDASCSDGVAMKNLLDMGFRNIIGAELNINSMMKARRYGVIIPGDISYSLNGVEDNYFDVIFSSHTLEHVPNPSLVINNFYRILNPNGSLIIILPYPEIKEGAAGGNHISNTILGLLINDEAQTCSKFIEGHGFKQEFKKIETTRQTEVWFKFSKVIYA